MAKERPQGTDERMRGGSIPANTPSNKEPAEGSRETVTDSGTPGNRSTDEIAKEKAIARHARKGRGHA